MDQSIESAVEAARLSVNPTLAASDRIELGQFMSSYAVARHVAAGLRLNHRTIHVLDPGAGVGSLTAAVVERIANLPKPPDSVTLTAYEVEPRMIDALRATFDLLAAHLRASGIDCTVDIRQHDFLEAVLDGLESTFNVVVLNPPYRKLPTRSAAHQRLAKQALATPNLYSSFWSAALKVTAIGGEVVAITPRSFCNGTYFEPFRKRLLNVAALQRLHIYEARHKAFADDEVLQENVITQVKVGGRQGTVTLATSHDAVGDPRLERLAFADVVHSDDPRRFIRLPSRRGGTESARTRISRFTSSLPDLGVQVSTGRVVDFRSRDHLRSDAVEGTVPLIYPAHLRDGGVDWPIDGFRKANAIVANEATSSLLNPNGTYVLVRRFSAKEEPRRVVASVYTGDLDCDAIGFENHLNYIHADGQGIGQALANGLALYLNSSLVDEYVREFSGHTQVNAGDLRSLPYPDCESLCIIGKRWSRGITQAATDAAIQELADQLV